MKEFSLHYFLVITMVAIMLFQGVSAAPQKGLPTILSCDSEAQLCRNYPQRNSWDFHICLNELRSYIKNEDCRNYILGIFTCFYDIDRSQPCASGVLDYSTGIRECLKIQAPETISKACKETQFYEDIVNRS